MQYHVYHASMPAPWFTSAEKQSPQKIPQITYLGLLVKVH